jgi:hypothetical protein
MKKRILQILIAFDQFLNTLLGGYADETLSARAWRTEQEGKFFGKFFRPLIDTILFFDSQHCYTSYLSEKERKQYPKHYRN